MLRWPIYILNLAYLYPDSGRCLGSSAVVSSDGAAVSTSAAGDVSSAGPDCSDESRGTAGYVPADRDGHGETAASAQRTAAAVKRLRQRAAAATVTAASEESRRGDGDGRVRGQPPRRR